MVRWQSKVRAWGSAVAYDQLSSTEVSCVSFGRVLGVRSFLVELLKMVFWRRMAQLMIEAGSGYLIEAALGGIVQRDLRGGQDEAQTEYLGNSTTLTCETSTVDLFLLQDGGRRSFRCPDDEVISLSSPDYLSPSFKEVPACPP